MCIYVKINKWCTFKFESFFFLNKEVMPKMVGGALKVRACVCLWFYVYEKIA